MYIILVKAFTKSSFSKCPPLSKKNKWYSINHVWYLIFDIHINPHFCFVDLFYVQFFLVNSSYFKIVLKSPIFVLQKPAAPKNGVEFRQKSICAVNCKLTTMYNDRWRSKLFIKLTGIDRQTDRTMYLGVPPKRPTRKKASYNWCAYENLPTGWMDELKMKIFLQVGWMDWR